MNREAFLGRADGDGGRPVVVHAEATLDADVDPLAAYAALGDGEYDFLLESAEKVASSDPNGAFGSETRPEDDRHARYSFVGYDPEAAVTVEPDETQVRTLGDERYADLLEPGEGDGLDRLRGALPDVERRGFPDDGSFVGGLVGFLAYDAVYDLWLDEQGVSRPKSGFPDAEFVLNTKTLVFDHVAGTVSLVFTPVVWPDDDPEAIYAALDAERARVASVLADAEPPASGGFVPRDETQTVEPVESRLDASDRESYENAVRRAKEYVESGDVYQAVVSRERRLRGEVDPLGLYDALREVNPSPYMYLLGHGDRSVVGASPETLVSVRDGEVVANPIAGTCPRGGSPVEDRRLAGELLADEKERAEHAMLVDLARNDVRRVSEPGSVRVEEFMNVLKYSHVQHIESTVTGDLAADSDAFDATRAAFPAGTLAGAPKVRAMERIRELESTPRGLYGGGVGYYSWTGDADFAIVIRTATVEHGRPAESRRGRAGSENEARATRESDCITVRAGAGVVADSDPAAEFEETEQKMGGVLAAVAEIEEPVSEAEPPEASR